MWYVNHRKVHIGVNCIQISTLNIAYNVLAMELSCVQCIHKGAPEANVQSRTTQVR